jgi:zinc transporter ZupT
MLSAGFCHLLADSLRVITFIGKFPITTFLSALGFIITLCADQVVQHFSEDDDHCTAVDPCSEEDLPDPEKSNEMTTVRLKAVSPRARTPRAGHSRPAHQDATETTGLTHATSSSAPLNPQWHDHSEHMKVFLAPRKPLAFATSVLLAAALCVHSILEGMALGAQSSIKDSEDIMIAIAAHKGLAAYALGSSVIDSKVSSKKFWTVVGLFSFATPLGIFLGYALTEVASGSGGAALSALASGTFLYVAMMEVIPKELADPAHRVMKMGMLLLGFGLMSMLAIWA